MKKVLAALVIWASLFVAAPRANALTLCETGWNAYFYTDGFMGTYYYAQCANSAPVRIGLVTYLAIKINNS